MLVRELMASDPARVQATSPLMEAVRVLAERGVSALPVVDGEDRVAGILSEAGVLGVQITEDPRAHLAGIPEARGCPEDPNIGLYVWGRFSPRIDQYRQPPLRTFPQTLGQTLISPCSTA